MSIALFWCVLIVVSQPQAVHGRKVESVRRRASEVDEGISTDVPCPEQMFQCNDGRCIPSLWTCDNDRDCAGGEDESEEQCKLAAQLDVY
uniref:Uncharacterized protein n=1 Tax=Plectus sambesii TaxID=2011161 RepID=A0A914UI09_9BILA